MNHTDSTCLITGASSGIGAEFAKQLAARGAHLVLVARREDRLEALADQLTAAYGTKVTTIACDLTAPGAVPALVSTIEKAGIRPDTLINNAGFAMHGALVDADASRVSAQVALNVAALVDLTRAFLPDLTTAGRGALINVASTAAFQPIPGMAVYGATKSFVLSFTEALALETRRSGLRVLALCPGPTHTEFFEVAGTEDAAAGAWLSPATVVDKALRALDRRTPPPSLVLGTLNRVTAAMAQRIPRRLAVRAGARAVRFRPSAPAPAPAPAGEVSARSTTTAL